jgi:hypothetical protein
MNNVVLVHGGFVDGSGMGGRLQDPDAKPLQCHRRPKSYDVAGRRRSVHQASSGSKGRPCDSRWPLLRWSGDQLAALRNGQVPFWEVARLAGGPPLAIFACTIPTESAPSLRFLQGWAAMLRVLFDFVMDT